MEQPTVIKFPAHIEPSLLDPAYAVVDIEFAAKLRTEHQRVFEVELREDESLTRDLPNVGEEALAVLDQRGVARVGSAVVAGTLLVGVVAARVGPPSSPEEKLLQAIFGQVSDVVDRSLRAPPGCEGTLRSVEVDGALVRVTVAWERPLEVGDILRIGRKPVTVSAITQLEQDIAWAGPSGEVSKLASARDELRARSIGPYGSLVRQPLESRESSGGLRFTRDQARILAKHAPWLLWELCTIKSDCVNERARLYEGLVKRENPDVLPRVSVKKGAADVFSFFEAPSVPQGEVVGLTPDAVAVLGAHLVGLGFSVAFGAPEVVVTLRTDDVVREASHGRIRSPEVFDADGRSTLDGLRCAKVFGPEEDYRCACGKYARMQFRGSVCEECGVEVISSRVRRERFGHIELPEPCQHPLVEDVELGCIAVLPADLRGDADPCYQRVMACVASGVGVQGAVDELFDHLADVADALWHTSVFTKPVDYSGYAHLVADPTLGPDECRIPRRLVAELFKPFVYGVLEERGYVTTIKSAKRALEEGKPFALDAVREVSEGYPILLAADDRLVARKAVAWDEPAIAVDPATAKSFASQTATIHVPVTYQGAIQCASLPDFPGVRRDPGVGWLAQATVAESFVVEACVAFCEESPDRVVDAVVAIALGRAPSPLEPAALDDWAASDRSRCDAIRDETDERARRAAPPPSEPHPLAARSLDELEFSVKTANMLRNAGLRTVGDLCKRTDAELLKTKSFGRESLREVKSLLADLGLSLGMREV